MFYHLYTEQAGQLNKVAECQAFFNKDNAKLEAESHDNPVILASTSPDMPASFSIRPEVDHAIYDTVAMHSEVLVLWVLPVRSGLVAVPGLRAAEHEYLAGYVRNNESSCDWHLLARTTAGRAAGVPNEVYLF